MMSEFAYDVRAGLSKAQKELPSRYLYDELGSALFDAITVLPEYGLTRADERILQRHAAQIPREFPMVAELGSGAGRKTRPVLEALGRPDYFPIDVSAPALDRCRVELSCHANVRPLEASYLDGLDRVRSLRNGGPLLVLFLGSTIGNFESRCRADLIGQVRARMRTGDALLIGCDLMKPVETMIRAYDDPAGVTASFNLNLLGRINRELGGDFNLRAFAHEARYNSKERRIEMHLRSLTDQTVTVAQAGFSAALREGETIWTESSHKFRIEEIPEMARESGFRPEWQWVDEEWPFAENFWRAV
jgi:L-histidine N-alpha-methyltransferase